MKQISLIIILTFVTLFSLAKSNIPLLQSALQSTPKREVRAVWLTTIGGLDWPHSYARSAYSIEKQKRELCAILDKYALAGINTILIQTRIRGTVIYPSAYEPWDGCLSGIPGQSPGYDALEFAVEECHKRGMEIHAWVVCMPIGKWNQLGSKMLTKKHPELTKKIDVEGYMNPEKPQTANYIANICQEITQNYDIDGIHLDYIRYPETWNLKVNRNEGRRNITRIVEAVHDQVKHLKPWVKLSCSPIGKFDDLSRYSSHGWNAYSRVYQDAQGWLRDGLMDQLYPMLYFQGDQFFPFAINWQEESYGRTIVPGLGIYFMAAQEKNWNLDVLKQEMQVIRNFGMGQAYFRGKFLTDNTKGIYDFVETDFSRYLALVPAMTWLQSTPPIAPTTINVDAKTSTLSWSGAVDQSPAPYLLYNVYASQQAPVDINDSRNLVASRVRGTSLHVPTGNSLAYAVTAMDRFGNESAAIQSVKERTQPKIDLGGLLKCDGFKLELPEKGPALDANFVVIESLQGIMITTRVYQSQLTDVSALPEGMYILKSINKKGYTHRLGYFMIKRNANVQ